jgi:Methylamine utilisation protein MauE/AhpC/TSA family
MGTALLIARLVLAATFALAAVGKLIDMPGTRLALTQFGVPRDVVAPAAYALLLTELAVAVLLIPSPTGRVGAVGALALLVLFALAVGLARVRGRRPDCHCFGALHSAPAGTATLVRILALAAVSAVVIGAGPGRDLADALAGIDPWLLVGVVLLAAVLIAQALFGVQLMRQNGRLLERVRTLEEAMNTRATAPRSSGLPVGTPAPSFVLVDLAGVPHTLGELLQRQLPLVLAFSEPDCPACALMPALLERVEAERAGELVVALVSRGSRAENIAKLGADRLSTVLLQNEREVALRFGVASVPSALMISPDGTIASRLAVGPARIEELLAVADEAPIKLLAGSVR